MFWLTAFGFIALFISVKEIKVPALDKKKSFSFLIGMIPLFFHLLDFSNPNFISLFIDLSLFAFLLIIILNIEESWKIIEYSIITTSILVVLLGISQILGLQFLSGFNGPGISSFFGNTNMASQYLGISFCVIVTKFTESKKKINRYFYFAILVTVTVYASFLYCRSVLLSIGLITLLNFVLNRKLIQRKNLIFILILSVPAIFVISRFSFHPAKEGTHYMRSEMWKGSTKMISDHPYLGLGPEGFTFNFIPYQAQTELRPKEQIIFNSPHNEFLRIMVEYGIPFLITSMVIFILTFKDFLLKSNALDPQSKTISYLVIFMSVEALFQFPLLNAFSFFIIVSMFATCLKETVPMVSVNKRIFFIISFPVLVIFITAISLKTYSSFYQVNAITKSQLHFSCHFYPANWRACVKYAVAELNTKNFDDAEETLKSILIWSPHNFVALDMLGKVYAQMGHKDKMCQTLFQYSQLFPRKTENRTLYNKYCHEAGGKVLPR